MSEAQIDTVSNWKAILELLASDASADQLTALAWEAELTAPAEALPGLQEGHRLAMRVHDRLHRRQRRGAALAALVDTARDLTLPDALESVLRVATRRVRLLMATEVSFVTVGDPGDTFVPIRAADGHSSTLTIGFQVPLDYSASQTPTRSETPFWTADYLGDQSCGHFGPLDDVIHAEGLHAMIAVPLGRGGQTFGTLYAADRQVRQFTPDEVAIIGSLGELTTLAIERARMHDQTQRELTELDRERARTQGRLAVVSRSAETVDRLIGLVLDGAELPAVVASAAAGLSGAVTVRDVNGTVLASTEADPEAPDPTVEQAGLDAVAAGQPVRAGKTWVAPVRAGREDLGLLLLRRDEPLDEDGVRLLRRITQAVALASLTQRTTPAVEEQLREDLLPDLLWPNQRTPEQLSERARRLGVEINQPHVVVLIQQQGGSSGRAIAWAASYVRRAGGLWCSQDALVVLLLPGTDPDAVANEVHRAMVSLLGTQATIAASSTLTGPTGVPSRYCEAARCLETMTALGLTGHWASARNLGFLGLLLADDNDVDGFITSVIGPVLKYDEDRPTDLTGTLASYFEAGGSPTYAAEKLFVHPNTVSRRLDRITALLGADWQTPARALEVQLALRLYQTRNALQRQSGASAGQSHGNGQAHP